MASISVNFSGEGGLTRVEYRDDGPGYPEEMLTGDFSRADVGFEIIRGIVEKNLRGRVVLANDGGAVTRLVLESTAIIHIGELNGK